MSGTLVDNLPGKHASYWIASTPQTDFPPLQSDIEVDVAIVGGGITGITAGLLLKTAGQRVAILEAERVLESVTGHTTAKVTCLHTLIYGHLINQFGKEHAWQYAAAQQAGLEFIAEMTESLQIDCDFIRAPAYTYTETERELDAIRQEVEVARELGLPASFVTETELPYPIKGAVKFENQAHFHPRRYLLPLAHYLAGEGGHVFEKTRVLDVEEGEPCTVVTERGTVKARDVIIATHFPILNAGAFFARLTPTRHYVLGVYVEDPRVHGMYITAGKPLFSVRTQPTDKGPMLVIVGEGHQPGHVTDTKSCYQKVEEMTRERFKVSSIAYRWSTQDLTSIDKVPYIGRTTPLSEHVYVATGFRGWGMTNGTAAGLILADMILGRPNPWQAVFDPARAEQVGSVDQLLKQNAHVMKMFFKDRLKDAPADELSNVKHDEGKIVEIDGEKVAVYRDRHGKLHALSPVCSHLGCLVSFNSAERSWDCPCHGSRYDYTGNVLHGPAVEPLETKEMSE